MWELLHKGGSIAELTYKTFFRRCGWRKKFITIYVPYLGLVLALLRNWVQDYIKNKP